MVKVGCLVNMAARVVDFLGGSVLEVYLAGVAKKKRPTLGFGLQVMLERSLCISGTCVLQISCGTMSKL